MTADSAREQMSAGLDRLSEEEFAAFQRLNEAYRAKFNMPFVVCVRRHGKELILRLFEQRLRHDAATEREAAVSEILRIAALRLDQRVSAPDRLKVHGRLSTHVLDTHRGRPAEASANRISRGLLLRQIAPDLTRATTNADGRTDRPLIADAPIPIAHYELRFAVGDYFARLGTPAADPPFLGIVPVRFAIAEPEAHYHIPLWLRPGATPPTAEADGRGLDRDALALFAEASDRQTITAGPRRPGRDARSVRGRRPTFRGLCPRCL